MKIHKAYIKNMKNSYWQYRVESLLFLSDLKLFLIGNIINRDISNFERYWK